MPQITIVGLGPGEWKHLTLEAVAALNSHDEIWLRTRHHPLASDLPGHLTIHSFDALYDEAEEFAVLYQQIAAEVVRLGKRDQGVLYGVPGHPWVGESTVRLVVEQAREQGVEARVIEGLSFIEPSLTVVESDALDGLQIADATTVAARHHPPFDGDRPVLVAQLYSRLIASDVKLTLMELYPPDHPVTLIRAAGTGEVQVRRVPLHGLDKQTDFEHLTTLWVPPLAKFSSLSHFHNIIAHLRAPEGCPWDQEQDHQSLRAAILEEAYEAVDAIDRESATDLRDELGDLLLLIVMHAQIASEVGDFNMADVVTSVATKMIRRHPHVFATTRVSGSDDVVQNWEAIKAEERGEREESQRARDVYDEIPLTLPALVRAEKVARRAMKQGWTVLDPAVAFTRWEQSARDAASLGELLLALAAAAGQAKQNPEELLQQATRRLVAERRGENGAGSMERSDGT